MQNVSKIQRLLNNSNAIIQAFANFEKYEKRKDHYDKTGFGFNKDDRFAACKGLGLRVDSWMGVYGDSGCSRQLDLDDDVFNRHLLSVLQKDFKGIMLKVAESIRNEAAGLKQ